MSIKRKAVKRAGSLAAAVALALGALVPVVAPMVHADSQVQSRSIEMSDSTPSQSNVDYVVSFVPQYAAHSIVIDFCNNSSIIGGACTTDTTSTDTSAATYAAGTNMPSGWAIDHAATQATSHNIMLKDTAGTNPLPTSPTAITFTLSGITNPTYTGSFWARVYTYDDNTYGSSTTAYTDAATIGDDKDYGGFALSTVPLVNISATVMETLTFCVNKTSITTTGCGGLTPGVNLTLGGGNPKVLTTGNSAANSDNAFFQISTNALTGAVVKMKSHNACANGGLSRDGGATCPINGIGATAVDLTSGNPTNGLFGVNVASDTGIGSTVGTLTPAAPYSTSGSYAMITDTDDPTNSVTSGGGTKLCDTTGGASADLNGVLNFDAQAAATTPAGVYTASESLIATGTF